MMLTLTWLCASLLDERVPIPSNSILFDSGAQNSERL